MSKWEKFRSKILSGQCDGNIDFAELVNYLRRRGFDQQTRGSHNLSTKNGIDALINLQSDGSTAKRYQVRQIRDILMSIKSINPRRPPMSENKYESIIYWDQADGIFVVEVPELAGCKAHGSTKREALESAEQAVSLCLETARSQGREIPNPKGKLAFA